MKVIVIMAQTVDGFISRTADEFIDWSGNADKKKFVELTRNIGVIVMGSKTFDTIGRPLPGRKNIVLSRNPERQSLPPDLIFSAQDPAALLAELESQGYLKIALIGGSQINSLFARHNLIDEIYITVAPKIFGQGMSLFNFPQNLDLRLISTELLEENFILLHYSVVKSGL